MADSIDAYMDDFNNKRLQRKIEGITAEQLETAIALYGYFAGQGEGDASASTRMELLARTEWDAPTSAAAIRYAEEWWMEAYGYE